MINISRNLWALSLLSLALACAQSGAPEASKVKPIASLGLVSVGVVNRHSDIQIAPGVRAGFERFTSGKQAYGAMFVRPNGSGFGSFKSLLSLDDATQAARVRCKAETDEDCVLYATITPSKASGPEKFPRDLGKFIAQLKADQKPGQYLVIASDSLRSTASYYDHDLSNAKISAVEACQRVSAEDRRETIPALISAYRASGLLDCRIIGIFR